MGMSNDHTQAVWRDRTLDEVGVSNWGKYEINEEIAAASTDYRPCPACGADCLYFDDEGLTGGPCWGEVRDYKDFADEHSRHLCEGHIDTMDDGSYQPRFGAAAREE